MKKDFICRHLRQKTLILRGTFNICATSYQEMKFRKGLFHKQLQDAIKQLAVTKLRLSKTLKRPFGNNN